MNLTSKKYTVTILPVDAITHETVVFESLYLNTAKQVSDTYEKRGFAVRVDALSVETKTMYQANPAALTDNLPGHARVAYTVRTTLGTLTGYPLKVCDTEDFDQAMSAASCLREEGRPVQVTKTVSTNIVCE